MRQKNERTEITLLKYGTYCGNNIVTFFFSLVDDAINSPALAQGGEKNQVDIGIEDRWWGKVQSAGEHPGNQVWPTVGQLRSHTSDWLKRK